MESRPELPAGLRGAGLVVALPEVPLDDAIAPVEVLVQEGVEWFSTPASGELGRRLAEIFTSRIRLGVHALRAAGEVDSLTGAEFAMTNTDPRCWSLLAKAGVPAVAGAMTPREVAEAWASGVAAVQVIGAQAFGEGYPGLLREQVGDEAVLWARGIDDVSAAHAWVQAGSMVVCSTRVLGDAMGGGNLNALRTRIRPLVLATGSRQ